jgi:uncharacterized membrane protein YbhN (UPF0104 family)
MQKFLSRAFSLLGLVVFLAALWVLRIKLHQLHWSDVTAAMGHLTALQIAAALFFVCLSYFTVSLYDVLALRSMRIKLHPLRIMLTGFICHTLSHNVGLSSLTGGSMRYRLYKANGVTGKEVVRIISFNLLTFWLGLLTVAGLVFFIAAPQLPSFFGLPFSSAQPIGMLFLLILCAYLLWSMHHRALRIWKWTIPIPSIHLSLAQMLVGGADWIIGSLILYSLLPHTGGVTFGLVLRSFLIAQIAGLTSQAPAGLGVFETIILNVLPSTLPESVILGALLMYRMIYNVIPLIIAAILLAIREITTHRRHFSHAATHWGRWLGGHAKEKK